MNFINEFLSSYGYSILYTILMAVASFIGLKFKNIYEKISNDRIKRSIVEDTVKYVEQLYKDLEGSEKLKIAKENIIKLLNEKGININELELNVLIESVCNSFKNGG